MREEYKTWTKDKNDFLLKNKDLPRSQVWEMFQEAFPNSGISFAGFATQRSYLGAVSMHSKSHPKFMHLVGAEREKKGYIQVKVAMPNVWRFKHHVVYEQATGDKVYLNKDIIMFLDLNQRNFNPENLVKVNRKLIGIINNGCVGTLQKGNPELNAVILAQAQLKSAILDRGEKMGLVGNYGSNRQFRSAMAAKQRVRESNLSAEEKKARNKAYWERLKSDPERYARVRAQARERYHKNKGK